MHDIPASDNPVCDNLTIMGHIRVNCAKYEARRDYLIGLVHKSWEPLILRYSINI